jgi:peptidyl-prolyl cis-trans isomerase D
MSIIQQIQEKYAKLMAVIIAIALIIFVVMLAFENGGSLFNNNSTTVGVINGEKIDYNEFRLLVDRQERNMRAQGYGPGVDLTQQAVNSAWSVEVNRLLMVSEFNKLGMNIGKKELGDILYGANPPQDLLQQFTNEAGVYDAQAAKQAIDRMLREGNPEQVSQVSSYIEQLEFNRMFEKYNSLFTVSSNYPKWQIEKENADNSQIANISFVRELYSSIPDSAVKVSDKEIEEYISKHKEDYKQEESRSIAYVTFSALPTAADSAVAIQNLLALKPAFDTADNVQEFLESQGVQTYYDGYISGTRIQVPMKDSVLKLGTGEIYGPYLDGSTYTLAKMMGKRVQPDTVKVRHILISTSQRDPQTGQMFPVRDTASAKKLADSIQTAIRSGSNFDTLCVKFSEDPGSRDNGGVYEGVPSGQMVPTFNDFIFGNPVGSKGVVKTDYGYHYIEILSQKGSSMAYKVAYLPMEITASNETENNALNEATKFAGDSRDQKQFDANVEKLREKGINKLYAPDITPDAYQIPGLGSSRQFVKNIYEADLGDVLEPERVGDNYVVAIVTAVNKKGTQSPSIARFSIEPLLRNQKKAALLKQKIANATTLEAVSAAFGGKPIETADSIRLKVGDGQIQSPLVATEPKVVGAAFNPANKEKISAPIEGNSGVYVIRVENTSATMVANADVNTQREQKSRQNRMGVYPQGALREAATIKDNRSKFF